MYRDIATAVYKRAADNVDTLKPPGWAWAVVLVDVILFLPVFLFIGYTLQNIFPVLAIIEDPSPPAYEPVSLNADTQSLAEENAPLVDESVRGGQDTQATTSSFRATYRTVAAISGWKSLFRGIGCYLALGFSSGVVYGLIFRVPFIPGVVARALSALVLVHLYTGWLHIVISAPSPKRFWHRLPPFKKAFTAAALPTILYFVALEIQQTLPKFLARVMGMTMWDPQQPDRLPEANPNDVWKALIIFLVSIVLTVFVTIPSHVVLTRVQASLLPEEDETIVPFDRSFQGKVEPAIVGGRGYVTPLDAWKTFSRASWVRLVKLYLKIFAVSVATWFVVAAVLVPEFFIIARYSKKVE